jgi:gamma-glutamylcyclotransferase (GGCT)/AIG2-like uncharacterized protein YtfP
MERRGWSRMNIELFAYGTLVPGGTSFEVVAAWVVSHRPARVRGRLFDTGHGYPAATFAEDGTPIDGVVLTLADGAAALAVLDRFEGDEYERVLVRTEAGDEVLTYAWRLDTAPLVPIGSGRWHELDRGTR